MTRPAWIEAKLPEVAPRAAVEAGKADRRAEQKLARSPDKADRDRFVADVKDRADVKDAERPRPADGRGRTP